MHNIRGSGLRMHSRLPGLAMIVLLGVFAGCAEKAQQKEIPAEAGEVQPPQSPPPADLAGFTWTPEQVDRLLLQTNPGYQGEALYQIQDGRVVALQLSGTTILNMPFLEDMGVQVLDLKGLPLADLRQLEGLDLVELYVEDTDIRDLAPLRGMKLRQLYLSNTYVTDLSPLEGMPLEQLNLLGTGVEDISPLEGMPLVFLWLNETPVSDISPLSACSELMSLTLHRTQVRDLRPLADTHLKRLHIGETPVSDLSPLGDLDLKRLIFTPGNIGTGLDMVRGMESLEELGTTFENRMPADVFWHLYDTGSLP
jgi:internalin A